MQAARRARDRAASLGEALDALEADEFTAGLRRAVHAGFHHDQAHGVPLSARRHGLGAPRVRRRPLDPRFEGPAAGGPRRRDREPRRGLRRRRAGELAERAFPRRPAGFPFACSSPATAASSAGTTGSSSRPASRCYRELAVSARGKGVVKMQGVRWAKRGDGRPVGEQLGADVRLGELLGRVHFERIRVEPDGRPVIRHLGGSSSGSCSRRS